MTSVRAPLPRAPSARTTDRAAAVATLRATTAATGTATAAAPTDATTGSGTGRGKGLSALVDAPGGGACGPDAWAEGSLLLEEVMPTTIGRRAAHGHGLRSLSGATSGPCSGGGRRTTHDGVPSDPGWRAAPGAASAPEVVPVMWWDESPGCDLLEQGPGA